jgi:flavin-dependent dehydrogenase
MFDVAIIGGGPAGAAAGLSLMQVAPELRVLLGEASAYREQRIGETLAPGGQAVLEALGCWTRFRKEGFLESHGTAAAWGSADVYENEFLLSARGSAWHLDHARFDAMLAGCALDAGVRALRNARFVDAARDEYAWRLRLRTDQGPRCINARFVIDATGRTAWFAARQGARRRIEDRLAGVSVLYDFSGRPPPCDNTTLVEASADGWWYSAALPGSRLLVAWMSDTDLIRAAGLRDPEAWQLRLGMAGPTRARVAGGTPAGTPRIWGAGSQHLTMIQGEAWVAAGDAACSWDPLSSAGILKALRTGRLAAFVALDFMDGRPETARRYAGILQREHAAYREARAWFYRQEGRWRDAPFWARRNEGPRMPPEKLIRADIGSSAR